MCFLGGDGKQDEAIKMALVHMGGLLAYELRVYEMDIPFRVHFGVVFATWTFIVSWLGTGTFDRRS